MYEKDLNGIDFVIIFKYFFKREVYEFVCDRVICFILKIYD